MSQRENAVYTLNQSTLMYDIDYISSLWFMTLGKVAKISTYGQMDSSADEWMNACMDCKIP